MCSCSCRALAGRRGRSQTWCCLLLLLLLPFIFVGKCHTIDSNKEVHFLLLRKYFYQSALCVLDRALFVHFVVDSQQYILMKLCIFVVAYYLLWCGAAGTVYSSLTYDNIQPFLPFVGYYDRKVCIAAVL